MTTFTSIGELLIDFMPVVEEGRTVGFRTYMGGSPYNVAVALARLGARVEFAGKASTDFFGQRLVDHLRHEGVGIRFLSRSPAPSALAFVTMEGSEPSFAFCGEGSADTLLQPDDLPDGISSTGVLSFGSLSLLRGSTAATIADLVRRVRGRTLLCFDPNIRPSLVRNAAAYRQTLTRMFRAATIVKMSEADIKWFAPDRPLETVAADVLRLGPTLVVVTQGPRGAFARTAHGTIQVAAPSVEVVDTVGAGDAFTAGMLFALTKPDTPPLESLERLRADDVEVALRFAAAAAALDCTRPGADPPRRLEVEELLSRLKSAT